MDECIHVPDRAVLLCRNVSIILCIHRFRSVNIVIEICPESALLKDSGFFAPKNQSKRKGIGELNYEPN